MCCCMDISRTCWHRVKASSYWQGSLSVQGCVRVCRHREPYLLLQRRRLVALLIRLPLAAALGLHR